MPHQRESMQGRQDTQLVPRCHISRDRKAFPWKVWTKGSMNTALHKSKLFNLYSLPLFNAYVSGNLVWTQDGAPIHPTKATQAHLLKKYGSDRLWSKMLKPLNNSNLTSLNYIGRVKRTMCSPRSVRTIPPMCGLSERLGGVGVEQHVWSHVEERLLQDRCKTCILASQQKAELVQNIDWCEVSIA